VDRVVGLELGADDYVTKPFSAREVVARVKAVLRRVHPDVAPAPPATSGLSVDLERRSARCGGAELSLTKIELDLLAALLKRPGQVLSRQQLLDRVWGDEVVIEDRTVDVHVKSLRKKIREAGGDPECVETVRGVGYRIRE
jgi:DNA-binding response OmpR family regulator